MIHIPAGILHLLYNESVNWMYASDPEPGTGNRAIHWPRGRVLGGSSSINGMLFVRGNRADYDNWAQMGCRGWSYEECLPYFKSIETYRPGDDAHRGKSGPLKIEDYRTVLPLTHAFVEAAQQAGFPFTPDLSGQNMEGVGYSQMSRNGRFRGSTAQTFLAEARKHPNLKIETNALASRLLFDGKRCNGVAFTQKGQPKQIRAAREVIVSGGTINSPHLLQVSGVGPGAHLQSIGVDVVHDSPGVGQNLNDHYATRISCRVKNALSINEYARGVRLVGEVAKWLTTGKGALTFGVSSAQVFCYSRAGLASPDIQLLFSPASYDERVFGTLEKKPGATIAVSIARPESRGTIMATNPDPTARPSIRPNYLATASDMDVARAGISHARKIFASPAFSQFIDHETAPGSDVQTEQDVQDFIRQNGTTLYHPVGTCKMGIDPMAVTDPRLRVHGLEGLRVVDASVMPAVTTGNTNAPTIMIAEKAAAMIKEDAKASL